MHAKSLIAVSGLAAMVAAVPAAHEQHNRLHQHHARDYVWVTETEEAIVTVPVTQTVWLEPGETPPSDHQSNAQNNRPAFTSHPAHSPEASSSTSEAPAPYVPPTTSSTSQYVAPPTSSTSQYVAPTSSSSTYVPPPAPSSSSFSSVYTPAPEPTTSSTSEYVAPAYTPLASSSSAPAAYSAPASSSSASPTTNEASSANGLTQITPSFAGRTISSGMGTSGTSYTGDITHYDVAAGLGACGEQWAANDAVVAISHVIFQSYTGAWPNSLCGHTITIEGTDGSQTKATITDMCPGCAEADLDLSDDLFTHVAPKGDGRVHGVKWWFN